LEKLTRLDGLDIARLLAFLGMVIVNFTIVMGAESGEGTLGLLISVLQGKAAASFVVLAGIGLGLAARRPMPGLRSITLKRAAFLLIIGLLNSLIFDADILHYYALYFLVGIVCIGLSGRLLLFSVGLVNLTFLLMLFLFNYDLGWNWEAYQYVGFWTPDGFIRNLFFNGWHPVFPWSGFFLFGIWLSRCDLAERSIQSKLIWYGLLVLVTTELLSNIVVAQLAGQPDLLALFGTTPIPPVPLYSIAGIAFASVLIGMCLRCSNWLASRKIAAFILPAGRQTLTLYIAHIYLGMGCLEALGLLGNQTLESALIASAIFFVASVICAWLWSKKFRRGPVEMLMRGLAG